MSTVARAKIRLWTRVAALLAWACVPFLNEAGNKTAITWWGDAPAYRPDSTVAFLKRAVPALCEHFPGDPDRVILCGFSRGAIATNAIRRKGCPSATGEAARGWLADAIKKPAP